MACQGCLSQCRVLQSCNHEVNYNIFNMSLAKTCTIGINSIRFNDGPSAAATQIYVLGLWLQVWLASCMGARAKSFCIVHFCEPSPTCCHRTLKYLEGGSGTKLPIKDLYKSCVLASLQASLPRVPPGEPPSVT